MPPLADVIDLLLQLVLPTAATSAGVMALLHFTLGARFAPFVAPLSVAAGLAVSNWRGGPLLEWYPAEFGYNALFGAAALILLGILLAEAVRSRSAMTAQYAIPALVAFAVAWTILPAPIRTPLWFVGATALFFCNWLVIQRRAADPKPPGMATAYVGLVLGGVTALLMLFLMSKKFADLALLPTSAFIGLSVVAWFLKANSDSVLPLAAVYWSSQIIGTYDYLETLPIACYVLIATAPLCLAPLLLPQAQRLSPWSRHVLDALLLALPLIGAVGLMFSTGDLSFEG